MFDDAPVVSRLGGETAESQQEGGKFAGKRNTQEMHGGIRKERGELRGSEDSTGQVPHRQPEALAVPDVGDIGRL
ncbi:hypothetical protein GCM10025770_30200 [Viridibacterium curvum]|uniref:Uncharacterized protein n=1 Tax=Viridibacterium curvum TaxID=1101404 RepID=A0ABP9QXS9_9RHOO